MKTTKEAVDVAAGEALLLDYRNSPDVIKARSRMREVRVEHGKLEAELHTLRARIAVEQEAAERIAIDVMIGKDGAEKNLLAKKAEVADLQARLTAVEEAIKPREMALTRAAGYVKELEEAAQARIVPVITERHARLIERFLGAFREMTPVLHEIRSVEQLAFSQGIAVQGWPGTDPSDPWALLHPRVQAERAALQTLLNLA